MGKKTKTATRLTSPMPRRDVGHGRPPMDKCFKQGQVANPAGRPRGSKNRLTERFLQGLCEDFEEHGVGVIAKVREDMPAVYLRIIGRLVPAHLLVQEARFDELSDDEISTYLIAIREALGVREGLVRRTNAADRREPAEQLPTLSEAEIVP